MDDREAQRRIGNGTVRMSTSSMVVRPPRSSTIRKKRWSSVLLPPRSRRQSSRPRQCGRSRHAARRAARSVPHHHALEADRTAGRPLRIAPIAFERRRRRRLRRQAEPLARGPHAGRAAPHHHVCLGMVITHRLLRLSRASARMWVPGPQPPRLGRRSGSRHLRGRHIAARRRRAPPSSGTAAACRSPTAPS